MAARLLAVQAQDPRGVRLAIRARTRGLAAADVDRALEDGTLVIGWLNRGTLHLVRRQDYWWLHALMAPRARAANARRLAQEGVPPAAADRAVAALARALAEQGTLTRATAGEQLGLGGQALVHVLMRASLDGVVVQGAGTYALARERLGAAPRPDRARALAELARRYLAGHGPAEPEDLAHWSGLPLRDARAGFAAAAAGRADSRPAVAMPPRLLGPFDPVLLGWRSREWLLGGRERAIVSGGVLRAVALARGRAVATWRLAGGRVSLQPFPGEDAAGLDDEAADVARFLRGSS